MYLTADVLHAARWCNLSEFLNFISCHDQLITECCGTDSLELPPTEEDHATHSIYLHVVVDGALVWGGGTCLERPGTDADVWRWTVVSLHHEVHLLHRTSASCQHTTFQPNYKLTVYKRRPRFNMQISNVRGELSRYQLSWVHRPTNHAVKHALLRLVMAAYCPCFIQWPFNSTVRQKVLHCVAT